MEEETVNYNDDEYDDEYEVSELIIKTSENEDSNTLMKGYKKKKANYKTNPIYQGVYSISTIIDLDSDDYVELYGQIEAGDSSGGISNAGTFFGGYKLI